MSNLLEQQSPPEVRVELCSPQMKQRESASTKALSYNGKTAIIEVTS